MVLGLMLLVLTLAIAFWHYLQGLFTATISAILATVAALMAISYHENLASVFISLKFVEQAAAISLVLLFGVVYIIPRALFDMFIPGNVRFPPLMDKIGAGAMGVYVGLLSTGILAIAAQTLPFYPTIGGYSRYTVVEERKSTPTINNRGIDAVTSQETKSDDLNPADVEHLWFHQDDLVMGLARRVSDHGSMEGAQPLSSIHPDYLSELFGQRLGIQIGARHTILAKDDAGAVKVLGVYTQPALSQIDSEIVGLRQTATPPPKVLRAEDGKTLLIVRVKFGHAAIVADDADQKLRLSCGAISLTAGRTTDNVVDYRDYHPIGTLDPSGLALFNRIDDFIFVDLKTSTDHTIDFIFSVDSDYAMADGSDKVPFKLRHGTFLEIKRYSLSDLSGMKVDYGPPANPDANPILRKTDILLAIQKAEKIQLRQAAGGVATATTPGATADLVSAGMVYRDTRLNDDTLTPINCGTADADAEINLPGMLVSGKLKDHAWEKLLVPVGKTTVELIGDGSDNVSKINPGAGNAVVTMTCAVADIPDVWKWTDAVNDLTIVDENNQTYIPRGVWAWVQKGGDKYLTCNIGNVDGNGRLNKIEDRSGLPKTIFIAYFVPLGRHIKAIKYKDQFSATGLDVVVK